MGLLENSNVQLGLRIAAILVVTAVVAVLLRQTEKRLKKRRPGSNEIGRKLFFHIAVWTVYCIGIVAAIGQIQSLKSLVTTILAGSGIFAVVIGLAAQDGFSNIIGGIFLSMFHPFNVGDKVVLPEHNITGVIEDISLRHTVIRTINASRVIIPNGMMNSAVIENINYTSEDGISSWIDVSVAYDANVALAKELMLEVIHSHPLYYNAPETDDGPQRVLVRGLAESGVQLRAAMHTRNLDESFQACSDVREQLVRVFAQHGIEIPYNKLDVNLKTRVKPGGEEAPTA